MPSLRTRIVCAILAMMLAIASLPGWSMEESRRAVDRPACECCDAPGGDCCAVSEDRAPAPPLPPNDSRTQQALRDAIVPQRPLLLVTVSADEIPFRLPGGVAPHGTIGHSRQSVLCVRMV